MHSLHSIGQKQFAMMFTVLSDLIAPVKYIIIIRNIIITVQYVATCADMHSLHTIVHYST